MSTKRAELWGRLVDRLGPANVLFDEKTLRRASRDYYWMSPILAARIPESAQAEAVVSPRDREELAEVLKLAYAHDCPVTPRGQGTGNYGQSVPLQGGISLDMSRFDRLLEIREGWIRAEAGIDFVTLEASAREYGQELAMFPSTNRSQLGGFLAGGAGGTGSIAHGLIWHGFVGEMVLFPCTEDPEPFTVSGEALNTHLHAFGTTGVIVEAMVKLVPARQWTALFASFAPDAWREAAECGLELTGLDPTPRLCGVDRAETVALYPAHRWMPQGRISLRVMVDESTTARARECIEKAGGTIEGENPDERQTLINLSYNHVTLKIKQARPNFCHLQTSGTALVDDVEAVKSVFPETAIHLEIRRLSADQRGFGGVMLFRYEGEDRLHAGMERLRELGVTFVNVHTYRVGEGHFPEVPAVLEAKALSDPKGLLNPGKLAEPVHATADA